MDYRRDIDGLRAIAVFLVILSHAGFSFIPGGYVGVDVFFVISGFLITSIIYPKIILNTFSFSDFFTRRIKRLMPVLLFVIGVSTAIFSFILLPQDLIKFYKSVVWISCYGANFFFWREHGGYFEGNSQEAPFLHTWSLAVEEQYYLVWPLLLFLMIRYLGVNKSKITLFLLLIFSIGFSQWATSVTIGASYYLMPTRFFELLIGSLLAIYWNNLPTLSKLSAHLFSVIGLLLIVLSSLLLNEYSPFPGFNALYPVIGTALIIYSQNGIVNSLLSTKIPVFTGNISYSLYLWHWPVFVFFRYIAIDLTVGGKFLVICFVYLLSVFSWKYIENVFRKGIYTSFRPAFIKLYFTPSLVLCLIALTGIIGKGYPNRFDQKILNAESSINKFSDEFRVDCHVPLRDSEMPPSSNCSFGPSSNQSSGKFFVFGDSHANHLVPFFERLGGDANLTGQDYTMDRCLPVAGLEWGSNVFSAHKCEARNRQAIDYIEKHRFDYVVLAGSWPEISTKRIFVDDQVLSASAVEKVFIDAFKQTIANVYENGARAVVVKDIPDFGTLSPMCTIKKELFNDSLDCHFPKNDNLLISKAINAAKIDFPDVIVIDPQDYFCTNNICSMSIDGVPLYRDNNHLNIDGARILAEKAINKNINPFDIH